MRMDKKGGGKRIRINELSGKFYVEFGEEPISWKPLSVTIY